MKAPAPTQLALVAGTLFCVVAALVAPRWPQDLAYHHFADAKRYGPIPNALNVLSNLPFLWVGYRLGASAWARSGIIRMIVATMATGIALTAFGSGYYHWHPDNQTLIWDRLPMTVVFASLVALVVAELIGESWARWALPTGVTLGLASVLYWAWSEAHHVGDLRPYGAVQFGSMLTPTLMLATRWADPNLRTLRNTLLQTLGLYVLAKLCEGADDAIFRGTYATISGHTLKHVIAAMALLPIARMTRVHLPRQ